MQLVVTGVIKDKAKPTMPNGDIVADDKMNAGDQAEKKKPEVNGMGDTTKNGTLELGCGTLPPATEVEHVSFEGPCLAGLASRSNKSAAYIFHDG